MTAIEHSQLLETLIITFILPATLGLGISMIIPLATAWITELISKMFGD